MELRWNLWTRDGLSLSLSRWLLSYKRSTSYSWLSIEKPLLIYGKGRRKNELGKNERKGYNPRLHPWRGKKRQRVFYFIVSCRRRYHRAPSIVSRQWNRFDLIFPCNGNTGAPLASSAMNGECVSLARTLVRFVIFYAPVTSLHRRSPDAKNTRSKKSQNEISARPSELYKGFIVRHTRAPLHCMRIGAETVLRDKKLSSWLEKATVGDFKYRLRVLSFAKCLFKTTCDRARWYFQFRSLSLAMRESPYFYVDNQNRCNETIYFQTDVKCLVVWLSFRLQKDEKFIF